jgi:Xaa-Pro dipeptidase
VESSNTRVEQLQVAIAQHDAEALVLRLPENVLLATGYWLGLGGPGLVFVPRSGDACLVVAPYEAADAALHWPGEIRTFSSPDTTSVAKALIEILGELARDRGVDHGRVGFEGSFETVAPPAHAGESSAVGLPTQRMLRRAFRNATLVDMTAVVEELRAAKTSRELERLRAVNEIAMLGLTAFKELAVAGRTEAQIAAEVEATIQAKGHGYQNARVVRAYAMVCSGAQTAFGWQPFRSTQRIVERNDLVMIELGTVADGYWCDHTRTVVAGKPTARQRDAFGAVRAAQAAALAQCRPGARGGTVDAAARATCTAAGFDQFPHHTGHGVGFRYHESLPQLVPDDRGELRAGMVVAAEPGIYEEDLGGFRWEDDAVVADTGAVRLADTDYDFE